MAKFRKKPVVIEATQFVGHNWRECLEFASGSFPDTFVPPFEKLHIPTLEGTMIASVGDWIIKGVQGEFYPCKPDIFDQTYEAVENG